MSAKSVSNKSLFNLNISHDEFDLTNNVLKEYDNMTEEKKYLKTYSLSLILVYDKLLSCWLKRRKMQRVKIQKLWGQKMEK